MVTKVFSKSSRIRVLCIVLVGILCVSIHVSAIAWVRSNNIFMAMPFSTKRIFGMPFQVFNVVAIKLREPELKEDEAENEVSFEDWIYEQVNFICTEIYPDVNADYVLALIYHESRFKPDVVNSKTGATGLMQILPKWHTVRAEKLGVSLSDPTGNILTGCDILNEVYQQSGSISYALNVYAGGYAYANNYKNTKSPFERELDEILASGVLHSVGR